MATTWISLRTTQIRGWSGGGEDSAIAGRVDCCFSAAHVEFHENRGDMVLDGAARDEEPDGYLYVAEAFVEQ